MLYRNEVQSIVLSRAALRDPISENKSTKYQHTASIVHAIFKTDLLASYSNIMTYDNSIFLMYVMFYTTIVIYINFIKVFTYDKLNYGLKIHIGTDCY